MEWFIGLHPVIQGLLATLFTYFVTAAGASFVFVFKNVNQKILDMMMGFAAGVMIAAAFWSLLSPAIDLSTELSGNGWLAPAIGFIFGGILIVGSDVLLSKVKRFEQKGAAFKRSVTLTAAVTMHNIPEGLAVGVAFGCAATAVSGSTLIGAVMLAVGIGLQNFPEGACVSLPLRRDGMTRLKSFAIGQASGIVEPFAGVIGALFAISVRSALPVVLSFSAGAMIAAVCSELIPESFKNSKTLSLLGLIAGFTVMMILDVALG